MNLPLRDALKLVPASAEECLSMIAICLIMLCPLIMSVLAMVHRSIDYTYHTYPRIMLSYMYPPAFLLAALAVLAALNRMKNQKKNISDLASGNPAFCMLFFTGAWMILSAIVVDNKEFLFYGKQTNGESAFLQILYFIILLPAAMLIRDQKKKKWLIRSFMLISIILYVAAFALWHTQETSNVFYDWEPRFSSIYININYYGYMLALAIPLSASQFVVENNMGWKYLSLAVLGLNSIALAINSTMGAWVACFFAMIFLIVTRRIVDGSINRESLIATAVFIICMLVTGWVVGSIQTNILQLFGDVNAIIKQSEDADHAGSGRWSIWKKSLKIIGEHPVFGIGFEGITAHGLESEVGNPRPHNEYIQYALFYGIPAGCAYFGGCLAVYLRALRKKASLDSVTMTALTGAFGYLVSAFFGVSLCCITPFLFIFLGWGYVHDDDSE